jgi:hypothetical protein
MMGLKPGERARMTAAEVRAAQRNSQQEARFQFEKEKFEREFGRKMTADEDNYYHQRVMEGGRDIVTGKPNVTRDQIPPRTVRPATPPASAPANAPALADIWGQ